MKLRVAAVVAVCSNVLLAQAGPVQNPKIELPPSAPKDREAVKGLLESSYNLYLAKAFGHDDVSPVSESFSDPRNGWGATIVDALGTMAIMGLDVSKSIDFVGNIDFSKSKAGDAVSVFETTIRYVGGLLSAYELTGKQHKVLLDKAREVGDKLTYAWSNPGQVIPYGFLNFTSNSPNTDREISNIAEAGTLSLEFGILSKYTNNPKYAALGLNAAKHIAQLPAPLAGLAAQGINSNTGEAVGSYVTWGGGSDSCYEYYNKYARLFNPSDTLLIDTWATAVDSSIKKLLKKSTVGGYSYLGDYDGQTIRHVGSHLACFYGGNWILGGRMLNNETIVNYGLDLTDACWNTYASTRSGIGPETFAFISDDGNYTGSPGQPTKAQLDFNKQHGFYITQPSYILRPEVLESNFYAWRATGNDTYYKRAQIAAKQLQKYVILTKNGGAAGLVDVDQPSSGYIDDTQSFWFAEVLKYLYLTFDDPNKISLDTHVFNTEAHPFEAPAAQGQYGSGKQVMNTQKFKPASAKGPTPTVSYIPAMPTLPQPLQGFLGLL